MTKLQRINKQPGHKSGIMSLIGLPFSLPQENEEEIDLNNELYQEKEDATVTEVSFLENNDLSL